MTKSTRRPLVAAIVIFILTIGCAAGALIYTFVANNKDLLPYGNSLALQSFIKAYSFTFESTFPEAFYTYAATGVLYLGILFLVLGLVAVIAKRSPRFIILLVGGVIGFESAAFMVFVYRIDQAIGSLILAIACFVLGLLCFILSFTLPKRIRKEKEEVAAPAEEIKEEPKTEEKADEAPVEEPKAEETPVAETAIVAEPEEKAEAEEPAEPEEKAEPEEAAEPEEKPEEEEEAEPEDKPEEKAAKAAPVPADKAKKVVGKYEVFPEAGFFKYRLKANNGEILIVSNPYRTIDSALAGIDTLKKNVPVGHNKVVTDKNGYGQFRIATANDSRLVAAGEIYPSAAGAEKALNSVLKFFDAEKVVVLDEIPESEHREWPLEVGALEPKTNGKIQTVALEGGKFQATLFANNGELLFSTTTYSSRSALTKALENITKKLLSGKSVTIAKDKQNRYQFRLYSDNGMLLLMGETYPTYEAASKAAHSARNFVKDAKVL